MLMSTYKCSHPRHPSHHGHKQSLFGINEIAKALILVTFYEINPTK
jgi:hypothetical protein